MIRRRSVIALGTRARKAAQLVASTIADNHITAPARSPAWGQFLATSDDQVGVYGTSAAIQVLAGCDKATYSELIARACSALAQLEHTPTLSTLHKRRDQVLTHKLAFATAALAVGDGRDPLQDSYTEEISRNPPGEMLLKHRITAGWGWYRDGNAHQDIRVRTIPTCMALLALGGNERAPNRQDLISPLNQLSSTGMNLRDEQVVESALILLVLLRYALLAGQVNNYNDAICYCRDLLVGYMRSVAPDPEGEFFDENYPYKLAGEQQEHDYLTYPKDVLAPHAMLELHRVQPELSRLQSCAPFACKVTRVLCDNVEAHSGFRARTTLLRALVDQLWIHNYLAAFAHQAASEPSILLTRAAAALNRTRRRRAAVAIFVAIVTFTAALLAWNASGVLAALLSATAAVSGSVFAAMMYDAIRER